jgi:6-phosphofructokinase 1
MNAAVRAVVRVGLTKGFKLVGVLQAYTGLLKKQVVPMELRSVANILQRGGTILKSGRCVEFYKPEARAHAAANCREMGIDALVVIGGDGSYMGAHLLWQEHGIPVVGCPGTIDNDINGTDLTIGYDTAVNTALDAIDRIRDTAASHDRLFIVEVMGRESGHIAIEVGLAGGAEEIFIPENPVTVDDAIKQIQRGLERGKTSSILVAAEGQKPGRAYDLAEAIRKKSGFEAKVCVLGHVQRGGSPTAADRNLASRMGAAAIQVLQGGHADVMICLQAGQIVMVPMEVAFAAKRKVPNELIDLAKLLAN